MEGEIIDGLVWKKIKSVLLASSVINEETKAKLPEILINNKFHAAESDLEGTVTKTEVTTEYLQWLTENELVRATTKKKLGVEGEDTFIHPYLRDYEGKEVYWIYAYTGYYGFTVILNEAFEVVFEE